ncbi:MAG: ribulose-phosphate 3-epimerase [Proteobacteria bacterium]|nr:MAG: ribulose-phosphate 3-epimerase [Pseudomonadota bacterium]
MKNKILVAPSLLAADPLHFGRDLKEAEDVGADWHHFDVMDGHFVPNLTYGVPLVKALKAKSTIPLDVHIMVNNPDQVAFDYVDAGADYLVFPIETVVHSHRLIQAIQAKGAKAGAAISPGTPLHSLEAILPYLDLINVMSVNPGFGGQKFIPEALGRIRQLKSMLRALGRDQACLIEVDGGVNAETAASVVEAGADVLVAGTFFYGAKDKRAALNTLRGIG